MKTKTLPQLNDLYKEIILEHYRSPYGRIPVEKTDYFAEGVNPLCGDEVKLSLELNGKNIKRVHIDGHGCSISVASGSMLAQILEGRTIEEAKEVSRYLKNIMHDKVNGKEKDIGDLEALFGVKKFPVRIKCALLAWTTLEEALAGHKCIEVS